MQTELQEGTARLIVEPHAALPAEPHLELYSEHYTPVSRLLLAFCLYKYLRLTLMKPNKS
jgi:hypothetical protein